ncbi:MAG: hypothetical protein GY749_50035 [Desulfobacteraceae bacterium]|nr:hypothetical protein [Desulfobacteraceae bacterium]
MTTEISLNELSLLDVAHTSDVACNRLKSFQRLLSEIAFRAGITVPINLRTPYNIGSYELAPNYTLWNWISDPRVDKDDATYLLTVLTGTPWIDNELSQEETDLSLSCDVEFKEQSAKGLLFAFLRGGLSVSIASSGVWNASFLNIDVIHFAGNDEIENYTASVKHASDIDTLNPHLNWLSMLRKASVADGDDLIRKKDILFPNIIFCGVAESQIMALRHSDPKLKSLINSLNTLQEYCSDWETENMDVYELRNKGIWIRPETETTLNLYGTDREFIDPFGKKRAFSWHFDINPGEVIFIGITIIMKSGLLMRDLIFGQKSSANKYGNSGDILLNFSTKCCVVCQQN